MVKEMERQLEEFKNREKESINLKHKSIKVLNLFDSMSQCLLEEEKRNLALSEKIKLQTNDLRQLLPNCMDYFYFKSESNEYSDLLGNTPKDNLLNQFLDLKDMLIVRYGNIDESDFESRSSFDSSSSSSATEQPPTSRSAEKTYPYGVARVS